MRIIVIGATGTIGSEVAKALSLKDHEVIGASRNGALKVDLSDLASLRALFDRVLDADAVVSCVGKAVFKPLAALTDADYEVGLRSTMAHLQLVRLAADHLRDGGSITVTTGGLSMRPVKGSAAVSMAHAALEAFVRAAALEMPRGLRINAVCPPWVKETLVKRGMDPTPGIAASAVAKAYLAAIEGSHQGKILDPRRLDE
jgi:NAD(P)-dependent dehydrogenase (short-subunit alcohol dehydrogenase family)